MLNEAKELEKYFASVKLPGNTIKLSKHETILNCKLFIESHLATIKRNSKNKTFAPYLERLNSLKTILEAKK